MDANDLREMVKGLLLLPASPLCAVALGLLLSLRRPRAGRVLAALGLAAAWLGSTWGVADALYARLEAGQRPLDEPTLRAAMQGPDAPRAVVVVATGARRDGLYEPAEERLVTRSTERAVAAARIAKQAGLPVLVHGRPDGRLQQPEAQRMRMAIEADLGATVRWVESSGGTGHAEIGRNIARALAADGIRSVIVSTHAHNMPRLQPALEAAGLRVLPAPHSFRAAETLGWRRWIPNGDATEAATIAFYEWFGLLSYRLPGRALSPPADRPRASGTAARDPGDAR